MQTWSISRKIMFTAHWFWLGFKTSHLSILLNGMEVLVQCWVGGSDSQSAEVPPEIWSRTCFEWASVRNALFYLHTKEWRNFPHPLCPSDTSARSVITDAEALLWFSDGEGAEPSLNSVVHHWDLKSLWFCMLSYREKKQNTKQNKTLQQTKTNKTPMLFCKKNQAC